MRITRGQNRHTVYPAGGSGTLHHTDPNTVILRPRFLPAFLSASTLEAPNFSETAAAAVLPPPARLFLPSEKVVEVEEVREGVGEGGLLLPPAPPPDRSELVLPTYIEDFACILFSSFSIFFIHIFTINLMKLVKTCKKQLTM